MDFLDVTVVVANELRGLNGEFARVFAPQGLARWIGITIMITAVVISVLIMLMFAGAISTFIERHPTMKILALSFLILIGVMQHRARWRTPPIAGPLLGLVDLECL